MNNEYMEKDHHKKSNSILTTDKNNSDKGDLSENNQRSLYDRKPDPSQCALWWDW